MRPRSTKTSSAEEQGKPNPFNDERLRAVLLCAAVLFLIACWRMLDHGNAAPPWHLVYHNGELYHLEGRDSASAASISSCNGELPAHLSQIFFHPVPINSAGRELLMILPGIGETLAERIIDARKRQGRFADISDLANVPGLGQKRLAQLRENICFD